MRPLGLFVGVAVLGLGAWIAAEIGSPSSSPSQRQTAQAAPLGTKGALSTAVLEHPDVLTGRAAPLAFRRIRNSGASAVRIIISWRDAMPRTRRPASFDARNPADPSYTWSSYDRQIQLAAANGLEPIVTIIGAPPWAQRRPKVAWRQFSGPVLPDPQEFGAFATAAARRYSGEFRNLPRVRYWQIWNETNHTNYLVPQKDGRRFVSPAWYRRMLNAAASGIHRVAADNVVVVGGLSPFTTKYSGGESIGPLDFMELLLCVSRKERPRATCKTKVEFDVWAHHPYTSGGPTRKATLEQDASIGNLPHMRRMLEVAYRAGHIKARRLPAFWVTEFSWDTNPPDRKGLPVWLAARWTAEAMHRMWQFSGVSLVTWAALRDEAGDGFIQGGLYFRGRTLALDKPKAVHQAFRFPFVAYKAGGGVFVWGRTPDGRPGRVEIQQRVRGRWLRLALLTANRHGIFTQETRRRHGDGPLRARIPAMRDASRAFSLAEPPDRYVCPFGSCD